MMTSLWHQGFKGKSGGRPSKVSIGKWNRNITLRLRSEISMRILKSIWFFVDVSEGFVVVFVGFVLVLGEFLHPSVPFSHDVVKSSVNVPFHLSLFAGEVFLLSFSLVLGYFAVGRGGCGWWCERGCGFPGFESSLIGDSGREWWWRGWLLFYGCFGSTVRSKRFEET